MEAGHRSARGQMGRGRQEGRRRSRSHDEGAQGGADQEQIGLLNNDTTRGQSPVERFIGINRGDGGGIVRRRHFQTGVEGGGARMKRVYMDRFIDSIEWVAAGFVGIVAANIFIAVVLRNLFTYS